ncbi:RNA polymerase subunit sigma-70 [Nocardia stercoris]|uniref:Sigma-70 family RNA polymerase sigma factor n=1 Tax=Nocardia stercoris TaxID=2483361 RepID=A0A3M2L526_9NOCA|nr:RNA polymerase subunit sigma-70 [Nocardia stercoris]RMI29628.1 sigma-70 family RNA polymerase sigma factor [Nocardia stercoris]
MTTARIPAERSDFTTATEPLRHELLVYCYRMLGSIHDAEEVLQDVYLDAWRAYDRFEGRASVRTWMYRITSRAAVRAAERRGRRPLPSELGPAVDPSDGFVRSEIAWLEPLPDASAADPAVTAVRREGVRLALIAALQHLTPRQRAVLILREVLEWSARETAVALDMSVPAVNSALQRARDRLPAADEHRAEPGEARQRELVDRYAAAFENADVRALVDVLTADAAFEMPPYRLWLTGRDRVIAFLTDRVAELGTLATVITSANGQPAVAVYRQGADGAWHAHALNVLTCTAGGVSRTVAFQQPDLFPAFGLPMHSALRP